MAAICQRSEAALHAVGDKFGIAKRYTRYEDLLADPDIDAVHINTPIPDHAAQSIAALRAGKHVACTVPMATSVEDCRKIVEFHDHCLDVRESIVTKDHGFSPRRVNLQIEASCDALREKGTCPRSSRTVKRIQIK
jgi:hypothetical protein